MAMHHTTSQFRSTGVTSRVLLTVLGAAGLIFGAFLDWTRNLQGTHVSWKAVYQDTFGTTNEIVQSVGGASILLGLLAVLGLADAGGWLVRVAGALGIVGSILFIIQVQDSSDHSLQAGLWFALGGSVLCVIAGLSGFGARREVIDE
jgi:hypothetical protein